MHIKLNYFFDLFKSRNRNDLCVVSKTEVLDSLARMSGMDDSEKLDNKNPYIKTLISSGSIKGGYVDLDYDSSLYFAFIDLAKQRIDQWYKAYFAMNTGYFKDISTIEKGASANISKKVRVDYIVEINKKTADSAVAFSVQFCSSWLKECVIKSALTHKAGFNEEGITAELLSYALCVVEDTINKNVNVKNGVHLSIAS